MDAVNAGTGFCWYYNVEFYDAGNAAIPAGFNNRWKTDRHDEYYKIPDAATIMDITVGAHSGGSHAWNQIPAQTCGFKVQGALGISACIAYNIGGNEGQYSIN